MPMQILNYFQNSRGHLCILLQITAERWVCQLFPFECITLPNAATTYFSSEQIAEICNLAGNLVNGVSKELVGPALSNNSVLEYVWAP
jgi:hypothetical protein